MDRKWKKTQSASVAGSIRVRPEILSLFLQRVRVLANGNDIQTNLIWCAASAFDRLADKAKEARLQRHVTTSPGRRWVVVEWSGGRRWCKDTDNSYSYSIWASIQNWFGCSTSKIFANGRQPLNSCCYCWNLEIPSPDFPARTRAGRRWMAMAGCWLGGALANATVTCHRRQIKQGATWEAKV